MSKHFGYPSIEQFRNIIKVVRDRARFKAVPVPAIEFTGSVKLHGTNAGIVKDLTTGEIWAQSREHVITPEKDNAGFAAFIAANPAEVDRLFEFAMFRAGVSCAETHIAIFGEWCGQGIQKGVAISQMTKMFVVFGIRVITDDGSEEPPRRWLPKQRVRDAVWAACPGDARIRCIYEFPTYSMRIDFDRPEEAQNALVKITDAVEAQCPVAAACGFEGVGEGVVWCANDEIDAPIRVDDLIFKVKGQKHSDSKVKVTAEVDVEKAASIRQFADMVLTDHRLEKMVQKLIGDGLPVAVESTGAFLKAVCGDVFKEEADRLEASGLDWKAAAGAVSKQARQWWLLKLNAEAFAA